MSHVAGTAPPDVRDRRGRHRSGTTPSRCRPSRSSWRAHRHHRDLLGARTRHVRAATPTSAHGPERLDLGGARRGHDLRHHHLRHRPLGRVSARLLRRRLREGDGAMGGDGWGRRSSASSWRSRRHPLGRVQRLLISKAKVPPLIVTLGTSRHGARPRPDLHRRGRHPRGAVGPHRHDRLRQHLRRVPIISVIALVVVIIGASCSTRRSSACTPSRSGRTRRRHDVSA